MSNLFTYWLTRKFTQLRSSMNYLSNFNQIMKIDVKIIQIDITTKKVNCLLINPVLSPCLLPSVTARPRLRQLTVEFLEAGDTWR